MLQWIRDRLRDMKRRVEQQMERGGGSASDGMAGKRKPEQQMGPVSKRQRVEQARAERLQKLMQQCNAIVTQIQKAKPREFELFKEPVKPEKYGCHDYYEVIKNPMDFGTMQKKIRRREYNSPIEFKEDAQLVFSNCYTYNREGTQPHHFGRVIEAEFWKRWQNLNIENSWEQEMRRREEEDNELREAGEEPPSGPTARTAHDPQGQGQRGQGHPKRLEPMSYEEKCWLTENLESLVEGERASEHTEKVVEIIQQKHQISGEEIDLDVRALDVETQWKLHEYVSSIFQQQWASSDQTQNQEKQEGQQHAEQSAAKEEDRNADQGAQDESLQEHQHQEGGDMEVDAGTGQNEETAGENNWPRENDGGEGGAHVAPAPMEDDQGKREVPALANAESWANIAEEGNKDAAEEGKQEREADELWQQFQEKERVAEQKERAWQEAEEEARRERERRQEERREEEERRRKEAAEAEEERKRRKQEQEEEERRQLERQREEEAKELEEQERQAEGIAKESELAMQFDTQAGTGQASFLNLSGPSNAAAAAEDDDDDDDDDDEEEL